LSNMNQQVARRLVTRPPLDHRTVVEAIGEQPHGCVRIFGIAIDTVVYVGGTASLEIEMEFFCHRITQNLFSFRLFLIEIVDVDR
jgi:hypothetical protein